MAVLPTETDRRGGQLSVRPTCARWRPVAANVEGLQPRDSFWILRFLVVHDASRGSVHCGVTERPDERSNGRGEESLEIPRTGPNSTVLTTCRYEWICASIEGNSSILIIGKLFAARYLASLRGAIEVAVRSDLQGRGRC